MRFCLLLVVLALPLAAGGSSDTSSGPGTNATATLQVTVLPGKNGPIRTRTVTCPGDAACDRLAVLPAKAFQPVPAGVACSDIYSGPETATVQGTLDGRSIDASYARTNSCETARWNRVLFLLKG